MDIEEFGIDRFWPRGRWVHTTPIVSVIGLEFCEDRAFEFANACLLYTSDAADE